MDNSLFPDLEGYFELKEASGGHLDEPQLVQEAIAEQQRRKTYWRISFKRVQFGKYQGDLACLLVVEGKFAPEDRMRHRFTRVQISMEFLGKDKDEVKVKGFAPEWARGITVPEIHTSNWAIKSKASLSVPPIPVNIDILDGEFGHKKTYQIDRIASMQGIEKGLPHPNKVQWNLNEANEEGIPLRIPYLVVLVTCKAGRPFKLKFAVDASIGLSLNPQRLSIFAKSLEPVPLHDGMQLIPSGNEIDPDFTSLDLKRLTRTSFIDDA